MSVASALLLLFSGTVGFRLPSVMLGLACLSSVMTAFCSICHMTSFVPSTPADRTTTCLARTLRLLKGQQRR